MGRYKLIFGISCLFFSLILSAQTKNSDFRFDRYKRLMSAQNTLPPSKSIWIEELTYLEVRDRISEGTTTAIIATGGIEENGPYLATGKHNYILELICPEIVKELGNALCAPIIKFVPEGSLDPIKNPSFFPGTFSVRDETYEALLHDVAISLSLHGFKEIVFIGDSGGNQNGMERVANKLNKEWDSSGIKAHYIKEFYNPGWQDAEEYTKNMLGVSESKNDGHHDDIWVTAMMMAENPINVRYEERKEKNLASINGVDISNLQEAKLLGLRIAQFRAKTTAEIIRKKIN